MRKLLSTLLIAIMLGGCHLGPSLPLSSPSSSGASLVTGANHEPAPSFTGRVLFAARSAQATMTDVATASTVSLINTGTNQTVASSLTDTNGNFRMTFPGAFVPDTTAVYYLEAFKGLGGNTPGHNAARVRSVVQYVANQGWTSLTNTTPNSGLVVDSTTTALAIGAALRQGTANPVTFSSLIGKVTVGSPDTYTPVTNLSSADLSTLQNLVLQVLTDNQDPLANIGWSATAGWTRLNQPLAITSVTPASASVGTSITLSGSGFAGGAGMVHFANVDATVSISSPTSVTVTVPTGAISGQTTLQMGQVEALGPNFTVIPTVSSVSPASVIPGMTTVLTGSGFDGQNRANNVVTMGGVGARVESATATSLTVTVPGSATTGLVALSVVGSSVSGPNLTVVGHTITTLAGGATSPAANLPARSWPMNPSEPARDSSGNVYVADRLGHRIWKIAASGTLSLFAGTGSPGYSGNAGPAISASLNAPGGVAVDGNGNVYVADTNNNVVRMVPKVSGTYFGTSMTAGNIYTIAGNGTAAYAGDGGAATSGSFYNPYGVATDASGDVYVADSLNHRIRMIPTTSGTYFGVAMTANDLYTVAGNGTSGGSGDGGSATSATIGQPFYVAVDTGGNLLIANNSNNRIRMVPAAGGTYFGQTMTAADIYTIAGNGSYGSPTNGSNATLTPVGGVYGVAVDNGGNVYVSSNAFAQAYMVPRTTGTYFGQAMTSGDIYAVAGTGTSGFTGDGSTATASALNSPYGLAVDTNGNLLIADVGSNRLRIVAAAAGSYYGVSMNAAAMYTMGGTGTDPSAISGGNGFAGDRGPASGAMLTYPSAGTVDSAGNLIFVDGSRIRMVAATAGSYYGQNVVSGNVYTIAGDGTANFSDGVPATSTGLSSPAAVAVNTSGVYISDVYHYAIRKVDTNGTITTVIGGTNGTSVDGTPASSVQLQHPGAVAVDASGNLFLGDNGVVRMIPVSNGTYFGVAMNANAIYTIAGSSGGSAGPVDDVDPKTVPMNVAGLALDSVGNLLIADSGHNRIYLVASATANAYNRSLTGGHNYIVAGLGASFYSGEDGPAVAATLQGPQNVKVDGSGTLFVADTGNRRIRLVNSASRIEALAGNGQSGFLGDGGSPTAAEFSEPSDCIPAPGGKYYVLDTSNYRIRLIQ